MDEPIADEVRGILDGHVVLNRAIAARGQYPAIDVVASLSRVMDAVTAQSHRDAARRFRTILGKYESNREMIGLGGYTRGSDREMEEAVSLRHLLEECTRLVHFGFQLGDPGMRPPL